MQASHQHQNVQNGYRQYKAPFYPSSEAPYPKAPHSFTVQVAVLAVGLAQIALVRVGLAAKSLAGGSLDVNCPTGRCETGSVGFEVVNQRHDYVMGRTAGEPVLVSALAA